jgi:hypothetical protein
MPTASTAFAWGCSNISSMQVSTVWRRDFGVDGGLAGLCGGELVGAAGNRAGDEVRCAVEQHRPRGRTADIDH